MREGGRKCEGVKGASGEGVRTGKVECRCVGGRGGVRVRGSEVRM